MDANDIKINLGNNIKKYRKLLNLTQEELGAKIGSESSHLAQLENGKIFISSEMLAKLCKVFEILPNKLFEFTNPNIKSSKKENIDKINIAIQDMNNKELLKLLNLINFINSEKMLS